MILFPYNLNDHEFPVIIIISKLVQFNSDIKLLWF